jgi:predicted ATPase
VGSQAGTASFPWWTACDPYGANLSSVLFILKSYDDRRYRRILDHVTMVEPALEAINYIPAPGQQPVPFVSLAGQPRASWQGLSDGTLRALGLALIIETASACSPPTNSVPSLSLIEEPENGIFPGLLRRFFDLFEDWAPTAQFFFTSHSPYFIDMFDDKRECVTLLRRAKDRTETFSPPKAPAVNGDEALTLSAQYASELFQ